MLVNTVAEESSNDILSHSTAPPPYLAILSLNSVVEFALNDIEVDEYIAPPYHSAILWLNIVVEKLSKYNLPTLLCKDIAPPERAMLFLNIVVEYPSKDKLQYPW